MLNRNSIYFMNLRDPQAIVYRDATGTVIRLTRKDFASEDEFLTWKALSDEDYHEYQRKGNRTQNASTPN